jgi:hypothetical protein
MATASDDVVRPKAFITTASSAVTMSNKMPLGIQNKLDPFFHRYYL